MTAMTRLESLYAEMLGVGLLVLRQAVESGNRDWINAEFELLHNVPSLIGEDNKERHRYFWFKERARYVDWVGVPGRDEARSRMRTYYEPIWSEMEPVVTQFLEHEETRASMKESEAPA
jgi:hypothetical protein